MNLRIVTFLYVIVFFSLANFTYSQEKEKKKKKDKAKQELSSSATDTKEKSSEKNGIKPYTTVITKNAITKKGLFTVHQIDDKWYFEIPDSILDREIMSVTRFVQSIAGTGSYGGEEVNSQVIKFEKINKNKIALKSITYVTYSSDSTKPIFTSVKNSNADPIVGLFDIKAIHNDSAYVLEVSEFFSGDQQTFSLSPFMKENWKIKSFQKDKSYIKTINSYPINTEIKCVKTFDVTVYNPLGKSTPIPAGQNAGLISVELNTSFVLLPKTPMRKRYFDARVGFFSNQLQEFDETSQKVNNESFALRWRLEPKNQADAQKQANGELIEPKKPIIYYIDPATPEKWKKHLKAGIDDWQVAFEQAGWKNAIRGEYWPENDSSMNLEDARFSVIRYFASDIQNAYGPNVHDPRSGEIIESHIGWYHNLMRLLHNWYFIQCSPNDPRARQREFDEELMGQLIRFVSSHEVGHTLGLRHNMGASSATPVEKLRDKNWVKENGHTSSIMDYARFNYVAQPEDGVEDLFPRIGDYDKWAIEWGYRYFNTAKSADEEKQILNPIIINKIKNPRLRFGTEISPYDPRYQTEDLGDNAMKASEYGIKNLQRIVPNLVDWSKKEGENYSELDELYSNVVGQYRRYIGHVSKNIGGIYDTPKTYDMEGEVYQVVTKATQIEAINFINKQVFQTPTWLLDQNILSKIKPETGVESIKNIQLFTLSNVLSGDKLVRIMENSVLGTENLSLEELFNQLKNGIFADASKMDIYKRNLQKTYVHLLIKNLNPEPIMVRSIPPGASYGANIKTIDLNTTDLPSVTRMHLEKLAKECKNLSLSSLETINKAHFIDLAQRIDNALNPK
ncbi:MAG: zinc-dependent metalloprotease [Flavobacteriia bacterium]|nr:zinc-dependent metalloprotease [Flavobacteriia bacterium]